MKPTKFGKCTRSLRRGDFGLNELCSAIYYFKGNAKKTVQRIQKMGTSSVFIEEVENETVKNLLTLKNNLFSHSRDIRSLKVLHIKIN